MVLQYKSHKIKIKSLYKYFEYLVKGMRNGIMQIKYGVANDRACTIKSNKKNG